MNTLDWVFIVILALLGIRCMLRGFATEVLSVAAILAGLLAGVFLYKEAGQLFVSWGLKPQPELLPPLLGFAAVFIVAFLLVKFIERLIREGMEAAQLGAVDKALGLVLGLAEGLVLVSLVLVAMSLLRQTLKPIVDYSKLLEGSFFAKLILPIVGPEVAKATQGINLKAPKLPTVAPPVLKK